MKSADGRQTAPPDCELTCVEDGLDPINVVRDADAARGLPTGAGNTVLSPNDDALHGADAL